jgi:IrrE N-terminal-like domain
MSDYRVERLSIEKIEGFARDFLADCPKLPSGAIDILAALRQPRIKTIHGYKVLRLKLEADEHLPDDLAHVWSTDGRVTVTARASLWNRAGAGEVDALKDLRHELGHVLLHSDAQTKSNVTLDRKLAGNATYKFIEDECSAERQADWIAACLAMPSKKIRPEMDVRDVAADWGVPLYEAQWRLERARSVAPKRMSPAVVRDIEWLRAGSRLTEQAQALWDQLPSSPDTSPARARIANGFLIEYCQYNKYTQTGWAVEAGKIVPLMLKMEG